MGRDVFVTAAITLKMGEPGHRLGGLMGERGKKTRQVPGKARGVRA